MKKVYFIRHGATAGNLKKRYIGRTDEPLCPEGREQAQALNGRGMPSFDTLFVSPYLRCRQTAELVFPGKEQTVVLDLRECDFGIFEGKNYVELQGDPQYASWLERNCTGKIPQGECVEDFKERCVLSFQECMESVDSAAFVVHGGVIMAILEALAVPKKGFYEYHIGNCRLICCTMTDGVLTVEEDGSC